MSFINFKVLVSCLIFYGNFSITWVQPRKRLCFPTSFSTWRKVEPRKTHLTSGAMGIFFFTEIKFMIWVGASPWMALNITSNILNLILNLTGSQCSSCNTIVMWQLWEELLISHNCSLVFTQGNHSCLWLPLSFLPFSFAQAQSPWELQQHLISELFKFC